MSQDFRKGAQDNRLCIYTGIIDAIYVIYLYILSHSTEMKNHDNFYKSMWFTKFKFILYSLKEYI